MHRLRFVILGAVAALALGTASAVAMEQNAGGGTDPDQHGDKVSAAAQTTCPTGPGGVHGECVSDVASSKSEAGENTDGNSKVAACKATDQSEDALEKAPAKGDKAAKAKDKAEDKTEHRTFASCVSGGSATAEAPETNESPEAPDTK